MSGQLFIVSGPSGSGKSTIIRLLKEGVKGIGYSISHTSRRPRGNEVNGVDYHFVDRGTFERMIEEGAFAEWAEVYNDLYGTSFAGLRDQMDPGLDVVLDLDSQGAGNIKKHFKESILTYILPPSIEVLEKRLRARATDDDNTIRTRIEKSVQELQKCAMYDYLIVNDNLDMAVVEMKSIIISERCRQSRRFPVVKKTFSKILEG